jgi:hypothetical protein
VWTQQGRAFVLVDQFSLGRVTGVETDYGLTKQVGEVVAIFGVIIVDASYLSIDFSEEFELSLDVPDDFSIE